MIHTATAPLVDCLTETLASRPRRELPDNGLRRAAVVAPIVDRAGSPLLVFTRRTTRLEHYQGHVAFPGGRRDAADPDLATTALREMEEEIGVPPSMVRLIGAIDDVQSNGGFVVTPFVGILANDPVFLPSEHEVAELFEVPISALLDPAIRGDSLWNVQGEVIPTYAYRAGDNVIWGLTGRILKNLLDLV